MPPEVAESLIRGANDVITNWCFLKRSSFWLLMFNAVQYYESLKAQCLGGLHKIHKNVLNEFIIITKKGQRTDP